MARRERARIFFPWRPRKDHQSFGRLISKSSGEPGLFTLAMWTVKKRNWVGLIGIIRKRRRWRSEKNKRRRSFGADAALLWGNGTNINNVSHLGGEVGGPQDRSPGRRGYRQPRKTAPELRGRCQSQEGCGSPAGRPKRVAGTTLGLSECHREREVAPRSGVPCPARFGRTAGGLFPCPRLRRCLTPGPRPTPRGTCCQRALPRSLRTGRRRPVPLPAASSGPTPGQLPGEPAANVPSLRLSLPGNLGRGGVPSRPRPSDL